MRRTSDVVLGGAGEAADRRPVDAADLLGHGSHRLGVTGGGGGIARLDHVDPEARELVRHLELLGQRHRASGRLLAVAERGVEDADAILRRRPACAGGRGSRFAVGLGIGSLVRRLGRRREGHRRHGVRLRAGLRARLRHAPADESARAVVARVRVRVHCVAVWREGKHGCGVVMGARRGPRAAREHVERSLSETVAGFHTKTAPHRCREGPFATGAPRYSVRPPMHEIPRPMIIIRPRALLRRRTL